jgi:hypothetical protein
VLAYPNGNGGVAVYQPLGLSGGNGCLSANKLNTENIGDTPQTLAQHLAKLPQSTVLQPPTPVQAFGRDAVHLQLRIKNNCTDVYRVAETFRGGHGITYDPVKPVIIDFWVLEDGGVPVVAEKWVEDGAPSQVVDEVARTTDSITFENGK